MHVLPLQALLRLYARGDSPLPPRDRPVQGHALWLMCCSLSCMACTTCVFLASCWTRLSLPPRAVPSVIVAPHGWFK
eukprot:12419895-Karenia_brevis.AAC.1